MNLTPSPTLAPALGLIEQPACACSVDGIILAANPAMARLLGRTGLEQQNLLDFFTPSWRASAIDQLQRVWTTQQVLPPWHSTLQGPHDEMTVQIYLKSIPEHQAITLVFNDISAYHQDEVSLRRTLLEQQAILENAAVGILFSKSGIISECNIRTAEMFGYTRNQLIGQNSEMLFPNHDLCQQLRDASSPLLKAGHAYRSEVQLRHQDGTLFWCRVYGKAIDPWHTDEGTIWIMEDIGEIRLAQQLLQQTLLEVEAIMTNASVGISFTKNRLITRYNRRFAEMFGFTAESGLNPARLSRVSVFASLRTTGTAGRATALGGQAVSNRNPDAQARQQHLVGAIDRLCGQPQGPSRRHNLDY